MNTLKTVFVIAVLGIVGYGVYVALNNQPVPDAPDWVANQLSQDGTAAPTESGAPGSGGLLLGWQPYKRKRLPLVAKSSTSSPYARAGLGRVDSAGE